MTSPLRPAVLRLWPKLIAIVVVVCLTLIVWKTSREHDEAHVQSMAKLAATGVGADLMADLQDCIRAQVRLAQLWEIAHPSRSDWEASSSLHMGHYPGSLVLWRVDAGYTDQWVYPRSAEPMVMELRKAAGGEEKRAFELALRSRQPALTRAFQLPNGDMVALAVVPIFAKGEFAGFIANAFNTRETLNSMMQDVSSLGYDFAVLQDATSVYTSQISPGDPALWENPAEMPVPGTNWRVRVAPRKALLAELKSALPESLGLLIGALGLVVLIALHLAELAHRQARVAQASKEQLGQEITQRRRAELAARVSEERLANVLNISADGIISIGSDQRIIQFNQGAEQIFGYRAEEVLGKPLEVLLPRSAVAVHSQHVARFATSNSRTMLMCNRPGLAGRRKDGTEFPAEVSVSKLESNGELTFTAILRDVTHRVRTEEALRAARDELENRVLERTAQLASANDSLRQLSGQLLILQEEERRRIARELHDSTAQALVVAMMNLKRLQSGIAAPGPTKDLLDDCLATIEQATEDLRTVSYRLHPPMLEEFGLSFALSWYVGGFSKRSGIDIAVNIDPDIGRLPHEVELTVFRIVQEALTNVHRHAHTGNANVTLSRRGEAVTLEIADRGKGINPQVLNPENGAPQLGVGIAGMQERVKQLGGEFYLQSGPEGTAVTAVFPKCQAQSAVA